MPDSIMEIQINLGLSQVYLRTGRNKEAIAELEPAFTMLSPILDDFDSIVAQDLLPPRMACELLQRLMDVSMRLVDAEFLEAKSGVGPAIAGAGEAADRTARHLTRMKTIARIMPLLVKHFPTVAANDPALHGLAMICADNLLIHGQFDDALAVLLATERILAIKLASDPRSYDLRQARSQVLVGQGMAWADKGNVPEALTAFTTARSLIQTLLAEKASPVVEQFLLPCLIFLATQADEQGRHGEVLDLLAEMVAAAERVVAGADSPFAVNHARIALTVAVSRCVLIVLNKTHPPTAEEQAAARRLGLTALDVIEKKQIPFEDAKNFRATLEGK
jgi:hypothetical protein